jgi:HTH-type transcriptional regulator, competence development regulator
MKCWSCGGSGKISFGNLSIGGKLRFARENRGMSVRDVQKKTGINSSQLSRYETGELKKPPFDAVMKLCELYEIKPEELW